MCKLALLTTRKSSLSRSLSLFTIMICGVKWEKMQELTLVRKDFINGDDYNRHMLKA